MHEDLRLLGETFRDYYRDGWRLLRSFFTDDVPPIESIRRYFAHRRILCRHCYERPRLAEFDGKWCSVECSDAEYENQANGF